MTGHGAPSLDLFRSVLPSQGGSAPCKPRFKVSSPRLSCCLPLDPPFFSRNRSAFKLWVEQHRVKTAINTATNRTCCKLHAATGLLKFKVLGECCCCPREGMRYCCNNVHDAPAEMEAHTTQERLVEEDVVGVEKAIWLAVIVCEGLWRVPG